MRPHLEAQRAGGRRSPPSPTAGGSAAGGDGDGHGPSILESSEGPSGLPRLNRRSFAAKALAAAVSDSIMGVDTSDSIEDEVVAAGDGGMAVATSDSIEASVQEQRGEGVKDRPSGLQRLSRCSLASAAAAARGGGDGSPPAAPALSFAERRLRLTHVEGVRVNFQHSFTMENPGRLADFYETAWLGKLGAGAFGTVRKGYCRRTGAQRAIKCIMVDAIEEPERLEIEIDVARHLHHPNVVRLFETFREPGKVYLVMELCSGGELYDKIAKDCPMGLPEDEVIEYARQIFSALAYIHGQFIAHRDLKPENFLLTGPELTATLKLADFGAAQCFMPDGMPMHTSLGTAYYVAPEVLLGVYNELCDVWSAGCVIYVLICGHPPFEGSTMESILKKVRKAKVRFVGESWAEASGSARDFVASLLAARPSSRPSAKAALASEWLHADAEKVRDDIVERLCAFRKQKAMKQAAVTALAQHLPDEQIEACRSTFKALDRDGDGLLSMDEVREGLLQRGVKPPPALEAALRAADSDGSGCLDYTEFVAATCDPRFYTQAEVCRAAFHTFDLDGDGHISKEELRRVLGGGDVAMCPTDSNVTKMIEEVDTDGDGRISFDEFVAMMRPSSRASTSRPTRSFPLRGSWAELPARIDICTCFSPAYRWLARAAAAVCGGSGRDLSAAKGSPRSGGKTPVEQRRKVPGRQLPTRRDSWKRAGA